MCADGKPELRHGGFDCWEEEGRIDTGDYLADLTVKKTIFFFLDDPINPLLQVDP